MPNIPFNWCRLHIIFRIVHYYYLDWCPWYCLFCCGLYILIRIGVILIFSVLGVDCIYYFRIAHLIVHLLFRIGIGTLIFPVIGVDCKCYLELVLSSSKVPQVDCIFRIVVLIYSPWCGLYIFRIGALILLPPGLDCICYYWCVLMYSP